MSEGATDEVIVSVIIRSHARCSLEPRPNRPVLATAGSVMTVGLAINGCSHLKKIHFDEREQD